MKMKKASKTKMVILAAAMLMGAIAIAGVTAISEGTFFTSGTNAATVVIPKQSGTISDVNMYLSIATNATITIHRAKVSAPASAASSATIITLPTTATNTIGGILVTTSDFLIVGNSLLDIAGLAAANSATVMKITNTTSCVVELNEPVYVCDQADIIQFAGKTTQAGTAIPYVFTGFRDMPVGIQVPANTGAILLSGRYEIKQ